MQTLSGTGMETFPVTIPVAGGEVLGLHGGGGGSISNCLNLGSDPLPIYFGPDPAVGAYARDTLTVSSGGATGTSGLFTVR